MAEKSRILLIDDEKDLCFFLKTNLENTGEFDVLVSNRGDKGIKLAQEEKPDLILLDILMPGMAGDEVAEFLLDHPATAKIPIIFLTSMVTKEEIGDDSMKERGGRRFMAKPITTEEIVAAIKKVLEI
jgi:two-component system, OmpR family, alkaline phosphatase synthesis response regulator PhoP